jgi:hypothetical protein
MTLPRDVSDKLIAAPSLSLSPVAPVAFALSLKYNLVKLIFQKTFNYYTFLLNLQDLSKDKFF